MRTILFLATVMCSATVVAHGGGLNASGCHHDRKRGGYHCHNGNSSPSRSSPRVPLGLYSSPPPVSAFDVKTEIAQKMLVKLGYYQADPDGLNGSQTRSAIIRFQTENSLPATGMVSDTLIDALITALAE